MRPTAGSWEQGRWVHRISAAAIQPGHIGQEGEANRPRPPSPRQPFLAGTLAPRLRALDRPMATACLGLVTFLPVLPLLSLPSLYSFIASWTSSWAFGPYLRAMADLLRGELART